MKVQLDDRTIASLNRFAPPGQRSAFINEGIRRALIDRLEADQERAYAEQPPAELDLDPPTWEAPPRQRR